MARTGEEQPLTAVAGNDSAASNTGSTPGPSGGIINPSSGEDVSSPSAAAAAAAAAVASTARGAYGAVSGLVDKNSAANPLSGGNISLGDIYGEREGRGDRRGPPLLDADDEAAQMASAVIDAMETDSAKGVHNPRKRFRKHMPMSAYLCLRPLLTTNLERPPFLPACLVCCLPSFGCVSTAAAVLYTMR